MQLHGDISDERYSWSSLGDTGRAVGPRGSHPQPHYTLMAESPVMNSHYGCRHRVPSLYTVYK